MAFNIQNNPCQDCKGKARIAYFSIGKEIEYFCVNCFKKIINLS